MSLIRHFKMDDNIATKVVVDSTGTANGTAYANTSTMSAAGVIGRSFTFDGADSEVDCGSDFIGTTAITACAWINATSFGEGTKASVIDNGRFTMRVNTADDIMQLYSDGSTEAKSATNSVVTGVWQFWAITRTAATPAVTNFYLNGVLNGTADQSSGNPTAGVWYVHLGNNDDRTRTFDGSMDDVRVYNEVLTAGQIWDLYMAGLTSNQSTNPIVIDTFGVDTIIDTGPVTVTSIVAEGATTVGKTATFIDNNATEVLRLSTRVASASAIWTPPNKEAFTFQNGLRFDDSASGLASGDYVFIYLK